MFKLASAILEETRKPIAERNLRDPQRLAKRLGEFHFFDCTEIAEMARELAAVPTTLTDDRLAFLPADNVWLEFRGSVFPNIDGTQATDSAILLQRDGEDAKVTLAWKFPDEQFFRITPTFGWLGIRESSNWGTVRGVKGAAISAREFLIHQGGSMVLALLALINTPRVIGRKSAMPKAAIQRALAAARPIVGKWPLHAWTTLELRVGETVVERGHERQVWLTGAKALHFVRAHIRIVGGRVVQIGDKRVVLGGREITVSAHYRGSAAIGIKRTRYRMRDRKPPPPRLAA